MQKTGRIAVITAYLNPSSFFELLLISGFERKNAEMGGKYKIEQYSTVGSAGRRKDFMRGVLGGEVADGIISMFLKFDDEDTAALRENNIPVVFIDEEMKGFHSVTVDNFKGAYMATEYLIKKKKKNIGLVVGQMKTEGVGVTPFERLKGYKSALQDYGMEYHENNVVEITDYTFEEGEQALRELLKRGKKFDGVFSAAGDMVALGIMDEAEREAIDVPHDLAIIGYDDINMASLSKPPLTTIRQPIEEIGKESFRLLVETLEGKHKKPQKFIFDPKLIERGSA